MRNLMLGALAGVMLCGTALAQPAPPPPGGDPDGYYSRSDRDGYYDRQGQYHRSNDSGPNSGPGDRDDNYGPPPPPPGGYYSDSSYEENCRRGNTAGGTIFGALAGGLIGGAASHGNGGAVVGGAILGGLLGNAVTRDMPCEDHPHAFRAYSTGLNGEIGHRYDWRNGDDYGYFVPERQFNRGRTVCRSWTETTYVHGREHTRSGTACRQTDGNWRFDD